MRPVHPLARLTIGDRLSLELSRVYRLLLRGYERLLILMTAGKPGERVFLLLSNRKSALLLGSLVIIWRRR